MRYLIFNSFPSQIGVDIVEILTHNPRYKSASSYVAMFEGQLTAKEMTSILRFCKELIIRFYIYILNLVLVKLIERYNNLSSICYFLVAEREFH